MGELLEAILKIMDENLDTYMPGFTHLQKAQPVTLAHHMGAYFEMFWRDHIRLLSLYDRMNTCPLGSGAGGDHLSSGPGVYGQAPGLDGPTLNSMDGVSDRDYLVEFLSDLSLVMMHLSRFSEEIILWNSNEYQFVEIDDATAPAAASCPRRRIRTSRSWCGARQAGCTARCRPF